MANKNPIYFLKILEIFGKFPPVKFPKNRKLPAPGSTER